VAVPYHNNPEISTCENDMLAPMVAKKMGCNENPVVVVVSPFVALM